MHARLGISVLLAAALFLGGCGGHINDGVALGNEDTGTRAEPDAAAPDATPDSAPDARVPPPPPPTDASTRLGWLEQSIVGTWEGTRTDPWDPPATVRIHFDASGTYTAHCVPDPGGACVWHYGDDADSPAKQYSLYDLHANQSGVGQLAIVFGPSDVQKGTLDMILIDDTATTLSFDFEPTWLGTNSAVHFALKRVQ